MIKFRIHGVTKGIDENIEEGVLRWFGHVERIENNRITKRVYVGEFAGSPSVGRLWKRWIDTVKDCLKKKRGMGWMLDNEGGRNE